MNEHQFPRAVRHLEIGERPVRTKQRRSIRLSKGSALALLALAISVVAIAVTILLNLQARAEPGADTADVFTSNSRMAERISQLPAPDLLRLLSPEEAKSANSKRPVLGRPDTPSAGFTLRSDMITRMRAIDCLTQAIYYEAASEGVDGGRAVAQIVLNRVRHAGYPNSICGVVYQGSMRTTGCQFSFTCDGSLGRMPLTYLWARSRKIATDALSGGVFAPVGHATHYHADYVLPYWADSLDKAAVIGRHIFYRLKGASGTAGAFMQRYASQEPTPPQPSADVIEQGLESLETQSTSLSLGLPQLEEDRIEAIDPGPKATTRVNSPLDADLTRGTLIVGEQAPSSKAKIEPSDQCDNGSVQQTKAIGANSLKVGTTKPSC